LLLEGALSDSEVECIKGWFFSGEYFMSEQICIRTLFETLWMKCHSSHSDADHVWHEFSGVRESAPDDVASLPVWGKADDLVMAVLKIRTLNEAFSTNWGGAWS
jgi:hypothetical protein